MTDLTTMHLKCLLEQANEIPQPTTYTYKGVDASSIYHDYPSKNEEIYGVRAEMEVIRLFALAPELARELVILRDALADVIEIWQYVSTDPERTPVEQNLAAKVVDHIKEALGDHDE